MAKIELTRSRGKYQDLWTKRGPIYASPLASLAILRIGTGKEHAVACLNRSKTSLRGDRPHDWRGRARKLIQILPIFSNSESVKHLSIGRLDLLQLASFLKPLLIPYRRELKSFVACSSMCSICAGLCFTRIAGFCSGQRHQWHIAHPKEWSRSEGTWSTLTRLVFQGLQSFQTRAYC